MEKTATLHYAQFNKSVYLITRIGLIEHELAKITLYSDSPVEKLRVDRAVYVCKNGDFKGRDAKCGITILGRGITKRLVLEMAMIMKYKYHLEMGYRKR